MSRPHAKLQPRAYVWVGFVLLLLLAPLTGAETQESDNGDEDSLDHLFEESSDEDGNGEDEADKSTDEEKQESDEESLRSRLETSEGIDVTGEIQATAGAGYGWREYPELNNLGENSAVSLVLNTRAGLSFDARPDPSLRVSGTLFSEIDPQDDVYSWSDIEIEELFVDYIVGDVLFTRTGTFAMRWGQARIFTPGNFVEDSDEGLSVRASLPAVLDGITVVSMAKEEYFADEELPGYRTVAYAGLADLVAGPFLFSAGGRWREVEGGKGLLSVKTALGDTDLLSDLVMHYDEDGKTAVESVSGFYHEWRDLRLYGEYYFDGRDEKQNDHNIGLVAGLTRILGSRFGLGIEWEHTFFDDSGSVTSGLSWSPLDLLTARVGVPVVYGDEGSRYVEDNDDPAGRRVAVGVELVLSSTF